MIPSHSSVDAPSMIRASVVLSTGFLFAVLALGLMGGETAKVLPVQAGEQLAMDPAAFGSSIGHASIKAAPTIWSSRSDVRWNARWTTSARYLA